MFSKRPIDARGRWIALAVTTVVLQFAYWPIVASVLGGEEATSAGLWLGLGITPLVFLILAFVSRNQRAPGATGRAMGLFLLLALSLGLINIVVGLTAGFGAGAAAALRREPDLHGLRARAIAVVGVSVYLLVLQMLAGISPGFGQFAIMSGAVVPLAVVGLADEVSEVRAEREHEGAANS